MSVKNDKLTHNDFLYSAPLLLYSSPMILDSYINNDSGRKSFELFRKSYNSINGYKNLDTNVIVSYRRLKIGSKKISHIVVSDIEWNYLDKAMSNLTNNKNTPSQDDFED
ncbi:5330_t:CDS:2 [Racocetra persica]|uniref:5330_t:CDS:1 n=1 Tax=Racocetra persica TaxID=160502 RepID=A0ACA9PBF2_9GLOM|nr:5330_t:CDS:2 [Racocetra persica]